MKYSIRGKLNTNDGLEVITLINRYTLWRLITSNRINKEGQELFTFEVWLNTENDKNLLFNALKPFVNEVGKEIDWHECTHDEEIIQACVIAEIYRGE